MVQLLRLDKHKRLDSIGQKASSIQWLIKKGMPVPITYVLPYKGYDAFLADRSGFQQELESVLSSILDLEVEYAVRSSASIEDCLDYSLAGQLESVLSVRGLDNLVDAVIKVYASIQSAQLSPYLERMGLSAQEIKMAVVIQEMIEPKISGVLFTKNPITGLDDTIVEAVQGSGELLMQEGVTPERWVHKWGDWKEQPTYPQIPNNFILKVIEQSRKIVDDYGRAVDLEWVYDGHTIYWLQLRPITTLDGLSIYSNRISREVLPGMIKPLIWSVNVPLVNGAWIDLFTELIGPNDISPQDLSKAFHYRAYFNMKTVGQFLKAIGLPEETLELMMGLKGGSETPSFRPTSRTLRHLPRMIRFALDKYQYANKLEKIIPAKQSAFEDFKKRGLPAGNEQAILERIDELFFVTQKVAYANIVTPLMMYAYNALLRNFLAKRGIDYLLLDLTNGLERLSEYNPNHHLAKLHQKFLSMDSDTKDRIRMSNYMGFQQISGIESFRQKVYAFIDHFGHLSDSGNDFSKTPWRESPDLVLRMITNYDKSTGKKQEMYAWEELSLSRFDRWKLNILYQRARQFRFYREAVSFLYTYGYGLFREYFLSLGESFAKRGLIQESFDIFYLYYDEITALVKDGQGVENQSKVVLQRKQEMEANREVFLPEIIYGDQPPPLEISSTELKRLVGIATSPGYYQGPVRVIRSLAEYEQVQQGDVLVIPHSDVSWTPLFSKVGAVVAESGGILSHSSIVAREHNLPAVVSVSNACQLLSTGTVVLINGYTGEVIISNDEYNPIS
jgi:phosphoenolpyruvate synthase/pyruvate phosphate dikinase